MVAIGMTFKVTNKADWRFGRTYTVTGFNADRSGVKYIICEWKEEKYKSSHIFYPNELN